MKVPSDIRYFPAALFSMTMGLTGLSIAFYKLSKIYDLTPIFYHGTLILSIGLFFMLSAVYGLKTWQFLDDVIKEWNHPIKMNFVPTFSMSLLLIAIATLPLSEQLSFYFWLAGTIAHFLLTLFIMNNWFYQEHFEINHLNPAWFIPVVGSVLVPIAGVPLGYEQISWFFFGFSMVFWLALTVIIFYRLFFHHPLPEKLTPTLFILVAPPAVGFLAYIELMGGLDSIGQILYNFALFMTIFLLLRARKFFKQPFYLTWWAFTFPLAAITNASFSMMELTGIGGFGYLGIALLTILSLLVLVSLVRTTHFALNQKICVPDG